MTCDEKSFTAEGYTGTRSGDQYLRKDLCLKCRAHLCACGSSRSNVYVYHVMIDTGNLLSAVAKLYLGFFVEEARDMVKPLTS